MKTTASNSALLLGLGFCLSALAACDDPAVFIPLKDTAGPQGVIDGTVTYAGPAPCTRNGKILGAAVILAFEKNLLPPPEGLGTTAASFNVVPGEVLFSGVRSQLAFAEDGSTICGDPGSPITVSGTWAVGPFPAGIYQIRGFYDKYGDFDPGFSISNLPSKGDVGGGAIENAAEVLEGAPPRYQEIQLGEPGPDGQLVIPEQGAAVSGVAVTLGLPLPLERPIFHASAVKDENAGNDDAKRVKMPSDYQFPYFSTANVAKTESSFIRMVFSAGLPGTKLSAHGNKTESQLAAASPFNLPSKDPFLLYSRQDVNLDGKIDGEDHVPDSALIPSIFPVGVFVKLEEGSHIRTQSAPTIVLQGLTMYETLQGTAAAPANLSDPTSSVVVGLRPAVVCIDTKDPTKPGVLLATHQTALEPKTDSSPDGPLIIPDEEPVKAALQGLFGRPFSIKYGCLPQGEYTMNLIYGTGQAWTVPNEAGVCAAAEAEADKGQTCGSRPRLPSQDVVLTIGSPNDSAYCKANPTPTECMPAPEPEEE